MYGQINIVADYREVRSEIPSVLGELGADVKLKQLKTGDYLLNNEILIERKTCNDFATSIIDNRLFSQCSAMKKTNYQTILLIEGNPYKTNHDIDRQAIKGALISISVCWQIPILYSGDKQDSARTLIMVGNQLIKEKYNFSRKGQKPKRLKNRAIYFLQGLPDIGPVLAKALLEKFGSVENVIIADDEKLLKVDGLGKKKVQKIRELLSNSFEDKK